MKELNLYQLHGVTFRIEGGHLVVLAEQISTDPQIARSLKLIAEEVRSQCLAQKAQIVSSVGTRGQRDELRIALAGVLESYAQMHDHLMKLEIATRP